MSEATTQQSTKRTKGGSGNLIGPAHSNVPIRYHSNVGYQSYVGDVMQRLRGGVARGVVFSDWMSCSSDWEEIPDRCVLCRGSILRGRDCRGPSFEGSKIKALNPLWICSFWCKTWNFKVFDGLLQMRGSNICPPPPIYSELSEYFPACPPVPFSLHTSTIAPHHPLTTHTTLSRNSAPFISDGYGAIFSVGGPVWAMDWAPVSTATANQILAVAPYRNRYDVSS